MKEEMHKGLESEKQSVVTKKAEKNPYSAQLSQSLLKVAGVFAGYYAINKFAPGEYANMANGLSMLIGGALSVDLTAAVLNFFGFKKFKKTHKGKQFDSYYFERQRIQDNQSLYGGHRK